MKVIPGEFLSIEEELAPASGAYAENGNVYSNVIGTRKDDSEKRTVSIAPATIVKLISKGVEVTAVVQDIYDQIALIQFTPANAKPRIAYGNSYGYLRISELVGGYVDQFRDLVRIGDILKARVVEVKDMGIYISIKDHDLGVIKAFCSHCRHELTMQEASPFMNCPKCHNRERRKTPGSKLREDDGEPRERRGPPRFNGGSREGNFKNRPRSGGFEKREYNDRPRNRDERKPFNKNNPHGQNNSSFRERRQQDNSI